MTTPATQKYAVGDLVNVLRAPPLAARPPWPRNSDQGVVEQGGLAPGSDTRTGPVFPEPKDTHGPYYGLGTTGPSTWHPPASAHMNPRHNVSLKPFKLDIKPRQPVVGDVVRLKLDRQAHYGHLDGQVCVVMEVWTGSWNSSDPNGDHEIWKVTLRPMATPWETWTMRDPRNNLEWV